MPMRQDIPLKIAARRAVLGRCPCCGQGKLYRAYLKQVENCSACGERFGHIRADDAAPWLTLILVGHLFVPLMLVFVAMSELGVWTQAAMWSVIFAGLCLVILPRSKAFFIALLWLTGAGEGKQKIA
jgi:uncharacterized protein (DUF983 family)